MVCPRPLPHPAFGPRREAVDDRRRRLAWPEAKAARIKRRALNDAMKRHTGSSLYLERLAAPGDLDSATRWVGDGRTPQPVPNGCWLQFERQGRGAGDLYKSASDTRARTLKAVES